MRSAEETLDFIDHSIVACIHWPDKLGGVDGALAHYLRLLQFRRWLLDKTPRDRVRLTTIQQEYTRFHPGPWSTEALLRFWEQEKEEWGRGNL